MMIFIKLFVIMLVLITNEGSYGESGPNRHRPQMLSFFKGSIEENADYVELNSPLFAIDKDAPHISGHICEYKIYSNAKNFPFEIKLLNETTGEAEIYLSDDVNCSVNSTFEFSISAVDCGDGNHNHQLESLRSDVIIDVVDVNDYAPVFDKSHYYVKINEPTSEDEVLLQVQAFDDDCTKEFNEICGYLIRHDHSKIFKIDNEGKITMKPPSKKNRTSSSKYSFSVVAYDCDNFKSETVKVTIIILPNCKPSWQGIQKRIEYSPNNARKQILFPSANIDICMENTQIQKLIFSVTLDTTTIGKGCDRDTRDSITLTKTCGASHEQIYNFLPNADEYNSMLEVESELRFNLPVLKNENSLGSEQIFEFYGSNQVYNMSNANVNKILKSGTYSLSMWLNTPLNLNKNEKQTVLCESSTTGSEKELVIYFQRAQLNVIKLDEKENMLREWKWKLDSNQINDAMWHHYVLNINGSSALLLIDGLVTNHRPRYLEHTTGLQQISDSVLVIGACWQGKNQRFEDNLIGSLSGLTIYGSTIDEELAKCISDCQEGFSMDTVYESKQISISISKFKLTAMITGGDYSAIVADILSHLSYTNNRTFPTSQERDVHITTEINCYEETSYCSLIDDEYSYIVYPHTSNPTYTISGIEHVARPASMLQEGLNLFRDISLWASIDDISFIDSENGMPIHQLDTCRIYVKNKGLTSEEVLFVRPQRLLKDYNLVMTQHTNGITINGVQTLKQYEDLLRSIVYQHSLPKCIMEKTFYLQCSELNGRFETNQHEMTISVLHPSTEIHTPSKVAYSNVKSLPESVSKKHRSHPNFVEKLNWNLQDEKHYNKKKEEKANTESTILPIIIVAICVGLLVLLITAMVIQSHLFKNNGEEELPILEEEYEVDKSEGGPEMDWDDSALTITVNPLQAKKYSSDASENEFSDLEYDELNEKHFFISSKHSFAQ